MKWPVFSMLFSTAALAAVAGLAIVRNPGQVPVQADVEVARPAPPADEEGPRLGAPVAPPAQDLDLLERVAALEEKVARLEAELHETKRAVDPVKDILAFLQREKPKLMSARMRANRTAAVATLRNLISAQAQIQAGAKVDTDGDGVGEYGGFREMSGAAAGRMESILIPPVLSSAFRKLNDDGEVLRSGYLYRVYLPDARGRAMGEPTAGFDGASGIDADLAETTWCAYAWPAEAGDRDRPTFFTNQAGDVLRTVDDRYVGPGRGPRPEAAFTNGSLTGTVAVGKTGSDGNTWSVGG